MVGARILLVREIDGKDGLQLALRLAWHHREQPRRSLYRFHIVVSRRIGLYRGKQSPTVLCSVTSPEL